MFKKQPSRITAILLAVLVMLLWSTSWVLIKKGLPGVRPLTFGGLRYGLAFLLLAPFLLEKNQLESLKYLTKRDWILIVIYGILNITITQSAQYLGLSLLPAVTVNLIFQLTPLLVTFGGMGLLREYPGWLQWFGLALNLAGMLIYFFPLGFSGSQVLGLGIVAVGLISNAFTTIIGRKMNKVHKVGPLMFTGLSMGIGSMIMLVTAFFVEPRIVITGTNLGITAWMALVNTALAFTLWSYTQQTLHAMESSIIAGAMIIFVAIGAAVFLGETIDPKGIVGLVVVGIGAVLVQLKTNNR